MLTLVELSRVFRKLMSFCSVSNNDTFGTASTSGLGSHGREVFSGGLGSAVSCGRLGEALQVFAESESDSVWLVARPSEHLFRSLWRPFLGKLAGEDDVERIGVEFPLSKSFIASEMSKSSFVATLSRVSQVEHLSTGVDSSEWEISSLSKFGNATVCGSGESYIRSSGLP